MDKGEAERLVRAIKQMHIAWLQVRKIVLNSTSNAYELLCSYREHYSRLLGTGEIWRARKISRPREWIDLQHGPLLLGSRKGG